MYVIKIPKISQKIFLLSVPRNYGNVDNINVVSNCSPQNALSRRTLIRIPHSRFEHGVNKLLFGRDLMSLGRVYIHSGWRKLTIWGKFKKSSKICDEYLEFKTLLNSDARKLSLVISIRSRLLLNFLLGFKIFILSSVTSFTV